MTLLAKLKAWLNGGLAEEKKPDPEDRDAREHAQKIEDLQKGEAFPVQLLRDKTKKPSDTPKGWDDIEAKSAGLKQSPYDCWVDVYEGPRGIGYVIHYETKRGQKTFRKSLNIGPETERERDWEEISPVQLPI